MIAVIITIMMIITTIVTYNSYIYNCIYIYIYIKFLVTMGVRSLSTNIPNNEGIKVVETLKH